MPWKTVETYAILVWCWTSNCSKKIIHRGQVSLLVESFAPLCSFKCIFNAENEVKHLWHREHSNDLPPPSLFSRDLDFLDWRRLFRLSSFRFSSTVLCIFRCRFRSEDPMKDLPHCSQTNERILPWTERLCLITFHDSEILTPHSSQVYVDRSPIVVEYNNQMTFALKNEWTI